MSLLVQAVGPVPMIERLTVPQFHRMIEAGILREGEPIELIDGILVRKDNSDAGGDPMTYGPKHARSLMRLYRKLAPVEQLEFHLRSQLPITLSDIGEPGPDLSVIRGMLDDYQDRHPGPADTAAVTEVSDSSLEYDRTTKQRIYASARIPVYCIINISDRQIEVYEDPDPQAGCYAKCTVFREGETVRLPLTATEGVEVAVAEVLP